MRAAGPTLLSLVLPGAGQHVLGQRRKWLYLALEIAGWTVHLERRGAGREWRERYRDFAWEEGRIQSGVRVDGDFEYYETLTNWTRSGAFDADPAQPGVQPESDAATFNGSIWDLATRLFLSGGASPPVGDPAYASALAYYTERAYDANMLWDWSGTPGGQQALADLIATSDDRFREATTALGAVIANHLVSAVDAYLSSNGRSPPARLRFTPAVGTSAGWTAMLSVPVGR